MHERAIWSLDAASSVLKEVWGFPKLKPLQARAVEAFCQERDVAVLMPTGSGKSLCFQLPAVMASREGRGLTLVISPLIALMADQVQALVAKGVRAACLNSAQDELDQMRVEAHVLTGKLDLLYVSPERLGALSFQRMLGQTSVARIVVDEAHCISQWGHDFRPDYLVIASRVAPLRTGAHRVPLMALTATATVPVLEDLCQRLGMQEPVVVRGGFARPNLVWRVLHLGPEAQRLEAALTALDGLGFRNKAVPGRAILYAATRQRATAAHAWLKQHGVAAALYHAGLTDAARVKAQKNFTNGKQPVLVATNAFGMGVDQPDVRLVIHLQSPGSLEAYYQEAGRAGRDGEKAECILMHGGGDVVTQRVLLRSGKVTRPIMDARERALQGLVNYAHSTTCRQSHIITHFAGSDEPAPQPCGTCDVCTGNVALPPEPKRRAATARAEHAFTDAQVGVVLAAVDALRRPVGKNVLAKALHGSKAADVRRKGLMRNPHYGALPDAPEEALVGLLDRLLREGKLVRKGVKYPTVWPAGKPVRAARDRDEPEGSAPVRTRRTRRAVSPLREALDRWRKRKARELKWKLYMVCSNAVLKSIVDQHPMSLDDLLAIKGMGPAKVERFGVELLQLVRTTPAG